MDKTEIFKEQISPLVRQIVALATANGIPFVMAFQEATTADGVKLNMSARLGTASGFEGQTAQELYLCHAAVKAPAPAVMMCMAIMESANKVCGAPADVVRP